MNLVLGSCFRQSSDAHIARYAAQIAALQTFSRARGDVLHLLTVWGDSTDHTGERVRAALAPLQLHEFHVLERSHGFPNYGSSTHPDRLAGFAYAANGVFEAIGDGADVVIYVESDLIWTPETLYRGIGGLTAARSIIALPPFVFGTDTFYDIWAFRDPEGRNFGPLWPYWDRLTHTGLTEISAAGSCLVMHGEVARRIRCTKEEALVGFCKAARAAGYRVWTDWGAKVWHP